MNSETEALKERVSNLEKEIIDLRNMIRSIIFPIDTTEYYARPCHDFSVFKHERKYMDFNDNWISEGYCG